MRKVHIMKRLVFFGAIVLWGMGAIVFDKTMAASAAETNSTAAVSNTGEPTVTASPTPVPDASIETHTEGEAVWTYHKDTKCLVISGKGSISVSGENEDVADVDPDWWPWAVWKKPCYRPDYASKVTKIIIEPGITGINAGAFYEYQSLKTVEIADTVTAIEEYAFWRCSALKKVTMGNGIKKISKGTFSGCSALPEITIGKSVEKIDNYAFFGCSSLKEVKLNVENTNLVLKSGILYNKQKTILYLCPVGVKRVKIPKSVRQISADAFSYCKQLKKVSFPKGSRCSWIGMYAFYGCVKLQEMILPDSVQYMGYYALHDCKSLQRIYLGRSFVGFTAADTVKKAKKSYAAPAHDFFVFEFSRGKIKTYSVSKSNPRYTSQDGVLYNKDKTKLLCYPQEKRDNTVKIPNTVQVIQQEAFQYNGYIKEVVLSGSVKKIGADAFSWCSKLGTVTIRGNQVLIGSRAFCGCRSLSKVDLGNSVRRIKQSAFYSTKLKEIRIPSSVTKIGENALGKGSDVTKLPGGTRRYIQRNVAGFKIYGKRGSAAEHYARKNGFRFIAV